MYQSQMGGCEEDVWRVVECKIFIQLKTETPAFEE